MRGKISILFLLGAVACVSPPAPSRGGIVDMFESGQLAVLASCEFYNVKGEVIRKYPGDICVPLPNGDIYIADNIDLKKLDGKNQMLWSRPEAIHHQMKKSSMSDDVYFISGYLRKESRELIRHDVIKIVDANGKTRATYDFSDYLKTLPRDYVAKYKIANNWMFNGKQNSFFETTHVNSIDEIIDSGADGLKRLKGYVVNDLVMRRAYIFDPALKLVDVIIFELDAMHDVSFLDRNTLLYFVNQSDTSPGKSFVATLNLQTKAKNVLYDGGGETFFSVHNGGVQPLAAGLFLISHAPAPSKSYVEIVTRDGRMLKRVHLHGARKLIQDAELGDYRAFLKNSLGN